MPTHRAQFESASWIVSEPFTELDYQTAMRAHVGADIDGSAFGRSRSRLHLPHSIERSRFDMFRTRSHEWAHYRQHVSTQYGLFLHRLLAVQELCVAWLLPILNASGGHRGKPFRQLLRMPVLKEGLGKYVTLLHLWRAAEVVLGALWAKSLPASQLAQCWNLIAKLHRSAPGGVSLGAHEEGFCELRTQTPDALTPANGEITVRDIAESYAKLKEISESGLAFGERGVKWWLESLLPDYIRAAKFVSEETGLQIVHPVVATLIEMSIAQFKDPVVNAGLGELVWEQIHPGMWLRRATAKIALRARLRPNIELTYEDVAQIVGFDLDTPQQLSNWCTQFAAQNEQVFSRLWAQENDAFRRARIFQVTTFAESIALRSACPSVFAFPSLQTAAIQERYRSLARPPAIETPEAIFFPYGWGRDASDGLAVAFTSIPVKAYHEVAHEGEIVGTLQYVEKLKGSLQGTGHEATLNGLENWVRQLVGPIYGSPG